MYGGSIVKKALSLALVATMLSFSALAASGQKLVLEQTIRDASQTKAVAQRLLEKAQALFKQTNPTDELTLDTDSAKIKTVREFNSENETESATLKVVVEVPIKVINKPVASDPEVKEMIALINKERENRGLKPVIENAKLDAVAKAHSVDMVEAGFFSHDSPTTGNPFNRLKAANISFSTAGENIAMDHSVQEAHEHLLQSPGHRRNILLPNITQIGIGIVRSGNHLYITQMFLRP